MSETNLIMPNAINIEKSVLGSFLIYHDVFLKYGHQVQCEYFYHGPYKTVFEYMISSNCTSARIIKEKFPTLTDEISSLISENDSATDYIEEIEILRDRYERRKLIEIVIIAKQQAEDNFNQSSTSIIDKTISELNENHAVSGTPEHIRDIIPRVIDQLQKTVTGGNAGTATGLIDVDAIMGCFEPSELSIIAARPSMGKTSFINHIIRNIAIKHKNPVLFFSLEMSKEQITGRIIFSESNASYGNALIGIKKDLEAAKIGLPIIEQSNIYIDDSTGITVSNIYSKTESWIKKYNVKIIFIDHRSYIKPITRGRSIHEDVSEISKGLVGIARKFKIPVVLVSQLSRNVEGRHPPIPQLSDLRESGSLEEDARKVVFLYRDDYYNRNSDKKGMVDIIIAKNHNGKTGTVEVVFELEKMIFRNKVKPGEYDNFQD